MKTYQKIIALVVLLVAIFAGTLYVVLGKDFVSRISNIVSDYLAGEQESPIPNLEILAYDDGELVVLGDDGRRLVSVLPDTLEGELISYDASDDTVAVIVREEDRYNVKIKNGDGDFETIISNTKRKEAINLSREGAELAFAQLEFENILDTNPNAWAVAVYDLDTDDYLELGNGYGPQFISLDDQGFVTGLAYGRPEGFSVFDPTTLEVQTHTDFSMRSIEQPVIVSEGDSYVFLYNTATDDYEAYDMVWADTFNLRPLDVSFAEILAAEANYVYGVNEQGEIVKTDIETGVTESLYQLPENVLPVKFILK